MPMRDCVQPSKILRRSLAALTMLLTLFCALPGASALFFGLNPKNLGWAMALDPFNAFYYSQSGRMRDLEIAISLEPRNVWFRRKAADFHLADWQKFGNPASLESAQNEYETILKLAPNVPEFNDEYKKIFYH